MTALARLDELAVGGHQRLLVLRFACIRHGVRKLLPVGLLDERPVVRSFFVILAVIFPSLFVSFGLVLYGMRGFASE